VDLERIQYRGFKPRLEVEDKAELISQKILEESPLEGAVKIVIADQGDHFHLSVVGTTQDKKLFSSESAYQKKQIHGWPREWQIGALVQLMGDFVRQLKGHFKTTDDEKRPKGF